MRWMVTSWSLIGALLLGLAAPPAGLAVAAPAEPQVETLNIEQVGQWSTQNVRDIALLDSYAYVANNIGIEPVEGYLSTVDVSAPANPIELIERRLAATYDEIVVAGAADDAYLYSATSALNGTGLQLGVHDKDSLEQVCVSPIFGDHSVVDIWAAGATFFAVLDSGLRVYQPVATGDPPLWCRHFGGLSVDDVTAVAHDGRYAYVGTAAGALHIVDISAPESLAEAGQGDFVTGAVHAVAVDANTVYLAQDDRVTIVDVSDRSFPSEVASFTMPRSVRQLAAGEEYLTALAEDGVIVADVANPEAPAVVGYYLDEDDGGFGAALALAGGLIYTGGPEGMNILRYSAGVAPSLILQPSGPGVFLNGEEIAFPCEVPEPSAGRSSGLGVAVCPDIGSEKSTISTDTELWRRQPIKAFSMCPAGLVVLILELSVVVTYSTFPREKRSGPLAKLVLSLYELLLVPLCSEPSAPLTIHGATELSEAHVGLELSEGPIRFKVHDERLNLDIQTDVATVTVQGINDVGVVHLPDESWTYVACYAGSVTVAPTGASLETVTLTAGQQVTVTTNALGPITEIRYPAFLPLVSTPEDATPDAWQTLLDEDFEGEFPGPWQVSSGQSGAGDYRWGARDCRTHSGISAAWAVGGGADGEAITCGANYPNNVQSWMIYGPFDLGDATAADFQFRYWLNTPESVDKLFWGASTDGVNFTGWEHSGDSDGWLVGSLDMADVPNVGDLTGQPAVWVGIAFISDVSLTAAEGAYVDDVLLRKSTDATPAARDSGRAPATQKNPSLLQKRRIP